MKYFVYVHNNLTLLKAIAYADRVWGIDNTYILYTTGTSPAPAGLTDSAYHCFMIDPKKLAVKVVPLKKTYLNFMASEKNVAMALLERITHTEPDFNADISLMDFHDVTMRDIFLFDALRRRYKNVRIIMMEEGLSVYAAPKPETPSVRLFFKQALFKIMGGSDLPTQKAAYGRSGKLDGIICSRPEFFEGERQNVCRHIEREIDVYDREICAHFIRDIMRVEIPEASYDFAFLTQPLFYRGHNHGKEAAYDAFLKEMFRITAKHGRLLIKPHPKDSWDYRPYESDSVKLCSTEAVGCPYECLMGYYGTPQSITLFSSAACMVKTDKKALFLYDLTPELVSPGILEDDFINFYDIIRCKSFEEFEESLCV